MESMDKKALSDITVFTKYAKYIKSKKRRENWTELVNRNKNMHKEKYPHIADQIEQIYKNFVHTKKVLPSMRSLQFGGKPIQMTESRIYNCFGREESFITDSGLKSFFDFEDGDVVRVKTHKGNWKNAIVRNYGKQQLNQVTFKRGRGQKTVRCTQNHRWILSDGSETTSLDIGDILLPAPKPVNFDYDNSNPLERLFRMMCSISEHNSTKWIVKDIKENVAYEDVWCLEVDDDHSFILSGGMVTGNCAFAPAESPKFFSELMFLLLGGTGMGYSVQRRHTDKLPKIKLPESDGEYKFQIQDSIVGWADAIKVTCKAFFNAGTLPIFDYRDIRAKGEELVTTGGLAPGPEPLRSCVEKLIVVLRGAVGRRLEPIEVHDMACIIADAVLAGGIRRAAMISLFDRNDEAMLTSKFGEWYITHPYRARANNSAVLPRGEVTEEEFLMLLKTIEASGCGEPGVYWTNNKDWATNPCCFVGETLVATADGRNAVSIKQLCDEGFTGPVYSLQTQSGQVITSYCSKVWKSGENVKLVKITLDDGSSFKCTPDHRIMIRNKQYVQAKDLIVGTSLMPFNSFKRSDREYRMIDSNTGRDLAQYSHVAQYFDIIKEGYDSQHIHHIDGDGSNDLPSNLEAKDAIEHNREHMLGKNNAYYKMSTETITKWKQKQSDNAKGVSNNNSNGLTSGEMYDKCKIATLQKGSKLEYKELLEACGVKFLSKGRLKEMGVISTQHLRDRLMENYNHKVQHVEFLTEREDVYDMTVEGTHNFAIITSKQDDKFITSSGVFVHNCEISLRPYQMCNLTEINAGAITDQQSFNDIASAAAFIGTLQAGYTDFHYLNPKWKHACEKEALLGVSMTGIASGTVEKLNMKEAAKCVLTTNEEVAKLIGINKAARCTAVKPAGTTSLVLGTSSGIHAWHSKYYIRRMRMNKNEALTEYMLKAAPELVEQDVMSENQVVLSFPQKAPEGAVVRTESMNSLLERVKNVSVNWVAAGHRTGTNKHNVSCTISVKDNEWKELGIWMWNNRDVYNGISVLPFYGSEAYPQLPFEDITKEKYEEMLPYLANINIDEIYEEDGANVKFAEQLACAGGSCSI